MRPELKTPAEMIPQHKGIINYALSQYGARLQDDGFGNQIIYKTQLTGVIIAVKKDRIIFRSRKLDRPDFISSGPVNEETVSKFVEQFWGWTKK